MEQFTEGESTREEIKNEHPCEVYKIKASQILHKTISTQLLTVLTISVIVRIEQRANKFSLIPEGGTI